MLSAAFYRSLIIILKNLEDNILNLSTLYSMSDVAESKHINTLLPEDLDLHQAKNVFDPNKRALAQSDSIELGLNVMLATSLGKKIVIELDRFTFVSII